MTVDFDDLCFFICWYNDIGIIRTLESLPKESHKIIVDGKFRDYDSPNPLSHPALRDAVKQYDNVQLIDAPNLLEHEKRNVYLNHSKGYRYGFVIDSDEYIGSADWNRVFEALSPLHTDLRATWSERPKQANSWETHTRMIVDPSHWEYYKAHWVFRRKETGYIARTLESFVWLEQDMVHIMSNDSLRSKEFLQKSDAYQKELVMYELPVINAYKGNELR